jgi:hypothetical protein
VQLVLRTLDRSVQITPYEYVVDNIFYSQTVVPSQSNQILTMPVQQLVSQIKVR